MACWGNDDGPDLCARLPEVARADLDVLVSGHSQMSWDATTSREVRLLSPGSPTDRRQQVHCTWMSATVTDGSLADMVLHPAASPLARPRP